ncbi:MAG: OmpA family protein, partial [Deltaproteobacteria bacterium]|nr:OmpA family protein [Deltaproteobacteria bacterium]
EADMVDNTAKTWLDRGISLEGENKYTEAIEAFTRAIEIDSQLVEAYFKRGKASFAHDRTKCLSSLKDLTRVIDLEDDNAEAYYERALVNFYMINNEQGRKDMEKAASLGHKGARDWLNPPQKEERVTSKMAQVVEEATAENPPVVNFDFNSAAINPSYLPLLDKIGIDIKDKLSRATITVAGHADAIGSDEFNNRLSMKRAQAVKKYLMETYRIPSELILIEAYGESRPLVPNDSEENRALNRRVEIAGEE